VNLASQIESAMLAALEKRDAEYYNLLRARNDLRLAQAQVRMQDLRMKEAEASERLAELQRDKAEIQSGYFDSLLNDYASYTAEIRRAEPGSGGRCHTSWSGDSIPMSS